MSIAKNIALCIEYDGTHFKGWQAQKSPPIRSVERVITQAIEYVANHPIELFCAGRTDAGVHAKNQIINFHTTAERSDYGWIMGINSNLPDDCAVKWLQYVPHEFHARFSATSRQYQYVINRFRFRSALTRNFQTHIQHPLNIIAMKEAAQYLIGEHDFSAFRSSECQSNTTIREMYAIVIEQKDELLFINVHANAFLHHMVRNIVGVLLAVGTEKKLPIYAKQVLLSKDRAQGGITAPPQGLYLINVRYPDHLLTKPSQ